VENDVEEARHLETEARVFARYLVGRTPPQELIDRYAEANRILRTTSADGRDAALVAFVRRHPWAVPFLDAATGIFRRNGELRSKLLVMAAILETSPVFADDFLPRTVRPVALIVRLIGLGVVAVVQVCIGAALYAVAARSRA
jgi:hypothetical protein